MLKNTKTHHKPTREKISLTARDEALLEQHEVIAAIGVPTHADHVVTELDGEMKHGPMGVVAFEPERFVLVLHSPALSGFHELRTDPHAAKLGQDAIEPGEEGVGLEL